MKERVTLYDTTLRDGAQTQGVDFSVEDKRSIAEALDRLGIDYVEGRLARRKSYGRCVFRRSSAPQSARVLRPLA